MRMLLTSLALGALLAVPQTREVDWPANGRDIEGTRYLPASEITRDNVGRLEPAWTYRTGESDARFATKKPTAFEATPLVVGGTMYVGTPLGRVIALDPATGRERWVFDPKIARDVTYGDFASPLFPIEERAVPASDIPLEQASPTQPFTTVTPPLSPHRLTVDQVWGMTDSDRSACRAVIEGLRNEGIFTPPSTGTRPETKKERNAQGAPLIVARWPKVVGRP